MKLPKISLPANALYSINPIYLALLTVVVASITIVVWGNFSSDETIEWFIATCGLCFYAWMVTLFSFFNSKWGKFTLQSVVCYPIIGFIMLSVAHFVSTTYIDELIEYQMLLVAITIFFVVATVMSKVIQGITLFFHEH